MAPKNDRDDKTLDDPQFKPYNPFIKFRQFADSQISSLLQSIVGLPSAFSKSPNNAKWADFDEDVKRRDELRKRQDELKDSEARKQFGRHGRPTLGQLETNTNHEELDEGIARDIPLYSPVSRLLFSHLRYAKDDSGPKDGWKPVDEQSPILLTPMIFDPFRGITEPMKAFQNATYRDLQINPVLRSDYSLLPYILFSPYSPLRLESSYTPIKFASDRSSQSWEATGGLFDDFKYTEAFLDLMLTTQNRPLGSVPLESARDLLPHIDSGRGLVYSLWAHGVLQQSSMTTHPSIMTFRKSLIGNTTWSEKIATNLKNTPLDPRTELELYESFLHRATTATSAVDVFDSLNEAQDLIRGALQSLNPGEYERQLQSLTDLSAQKTGIEVEDERRRKVFKVMESLFENATGFPETPKEQNRAAESSAQTKIAKELEETKQKAADDSGRSTSTSMKTKFRIYEDESMTTKVEVWKHFAHGNEVEATCTTTEHTTGPARAVETKIEVWRTNVDGRSTTTTTIHSNDPSLCNDNGDYSEQPRQVERTNKVKPDEKKEEKTDAKNKGWFWN